jgi:hypothetical protein
MLQKVEEEKALGGNFVWSINEYVQESDLLYWVFCAFNADLLLRDCQIHP